MDNSKACILIVDDDSLNRMLLSSSLEAQGHVFDMAENGRIGWQMLQQKSYDTVLLDLIMPEMDGFELLSLMKADDRLRHIPVIVISSADDLEDIIRCIEMGATDHLPKPFDPHLLMARLNASLANKRFHDQEQAYLEIIQSEREKSDKLLQSILPVKIAEELKENGSVKPLLFNSVSVLFTDCIGFTRVSEQMLPHELVDELDGLFSQFDAVCQRNRMEKLKTIGDAYMCAGGLPLRNCTHAVDACLAALEFRDFMLQMAEIKKYLNKPFWELRIGVHSGPVIAGVIGTKKFAYDIWGDTVNTASRMESAGEPGKVNISEDTYNLVKEFFNCDYRGKIEAKGKGEVDMYFVNDIKPELSVKGAGLIPNDQFRTLLKEIAPAC